MLGAHRDEVRERSGRHLTWTTQNSRIELLLLSLHTLVAGARPDLWTIHALILLLHLLLVLELLLLLIHQVLPS